MRRVEFYAGALNVQHGRMQLWQHEQKRAAEQAQVELRSRLSTGVDCHVRRENENWTRLPSPFCICGEQAAAR